jgi:hypothetical protein
MRDLFPGAKRIHHDGRHYKMPALDWKARVVCAKCNNTWMSRIECDARNAMTPLITGQGKIPIGQKEARSIALFAFVKSVIIDHTKRHRVPFYSRAVRHQFPATLVIPDDVQMWIGGYINHQGGGAFRSYYADAKLSLPYQLHLYVCTFAIGHAVVQVVAFKASGIAGFSPTMAFDHLAVPLWPNVPDGFVWPNLFNLSGRDEFERFARRWGNVTAELLVH